MSDEGHIPSTQAMDMNRVIADFYEEMSEAFSQIPSVCDPDVSSALVSMHRALHKLAEAVTRCPAGVRVAESADCIALPPEPHTSPKSSQPRTTRRSW